MCTTGLPAFYIIIHLWCLHAAPNKKQKQQLNNTSELKPWYIHSNIKVVIKNWCHIDEVTFRDMLDYVARFERKLQSGCTLVNWHFILKSKVNIGMTWAEFKTRWWSLKTGQICEGISLHPVRIYSVCVRSLSKCLYSHPQFLVQAWLRMRMHTPNVKWMKENAQKSL